MTRDGRTVIVRAYLAPVLVALWVAPCLGTEGGQAGKVTIGGKVEDSTGRPVE